MMRRFDQSGMYWFETRLEGKSEAAEVYFRAFAAEDSLQIRVYTSAAGAQAVPIETDFGPTISTKP